jgi:hypothetical protein
MLNQPDWKPRQWLLDAENPRHPYTEQLVENSLDRKAADIPPDCD